MFSHPRQNVRTWNKAFSHRSRAMTAKKCTKKAWCRAKLLFYQCKPIGLLPFSFSSLSPLLKFPVTTVIIAGHQLAVTLFFPFSAESTVKINVNFLLFSLGQWYLVLSVQHQSLGRKKHSKLSTRVSSLRRGAISYFYTLRNYYLTHGKQQCCIIYIKLEARINL